MNGGNTMIILNEEAKEILKSELEKRLEREVNIKEITKVNDLKLTGVEIKGDSELAPIFYLENYNSCQNMEELINKIISDYNEIVNNSYDGIIISENIINKNYILENINFILVNKEWNENDELVSRDVDSTIENMKVFYCYEIYHNKEKRATLKVTKKMAETLNISENELYEAALNNLKLNYNLTSFERAVAGNINKNIKEVIDEVSMLSSMFGMLKMFILTNENYKNGAAQLLNNELLNDISIELESDLLIIPTSIDEVIIMPYEEVLKMEDDMDISALIEEVNNNCVQENLRLANNPFIYKGTEKQISEYQ